MPVTEKRFLNCRAKTTGFEMKNGSFSKQHFLNVLRDMVEIRFNLTKVIYSRNVKNLILKTGL